MTSKFVEHPILSSSEVASFLRETGLDFARWPQSVLPDEMLHLLDAGSDQDMEMLTSSGFDFGETDPEEYRAHLIAKNREPRAILRSSWGLLIGERWDSDASSGREFVRYLVQIEPAKGWKYGTLGAYSDEMMELLSDSVEAFNRKEREEVIDMSHAAMSSILELSVFIVPGDGEGAEEKATRTLASYLAELFESGIMDKVVEEACAGAPVDVAATGRTAGMRSDLP